MVRIGLPEVSDNGKGVSPAPVAFTRVIWIKALPDFDVLFQLLNNLRVDEQQRFWIIYLEADEDACDIRDDLGQGMMEVKIVFSVSHNTLTSVEEYVQ